MSTPDRIWAFEPDIFDNMSVWQDSPSPAGDTLEYIRADLVDPLSDPRVVALVEASKEMFAAFYSNGDVTDRHLRACKSGVKLEAALRAIEEEK